MAGAQDPGVHTDSPAISQAQTFLRDSSMSIPGADASLGEGSRGAYPPTLDFQASLGTCGYSKNLSLKLQLQKPFFPLPF